MSLTMTDAKIFINGRQLFDCAELNPPKDTLATTDTDGWIEEGGSISEEIKIILQKALTH